MRNEQELSQARPETEMERAILDGPMTSNKEYKPTHEELIHINKEALREYEIRIKFLNRGCIVSVGCKEVAFEDNIEAINAVSAYVKNPWEQQQVWRKILD